MYEKLYTYNISENAKSLISTSIHSTSANDTVQSLLDCSTIPEVISETQQIGPLILEELFRYTRAWCYSIHKSRLKLQGRWTKQLIKIMPYFSPEATKPLSIMLFIFVKHMLMTMTEFDTIR